MHTEKSLNDRLVAAYAAAGFDSRDKMPRRWSDVFFMISLLDRLDECSAPELAEVRVSIARRVARLEKESSNV